MKKKEMSMDEIIDSYLEQKPIQQTKKQPSRLKRAEQVFTTIDNELKLNSHRHIYINTTERFLARNSALIGAIGTVYNLAQDNTNLALVSSVAFCTLMGINSYLNHGGRNYNNSYSAMYRDKLTHTESLYELIDCKPQGGNLSNFSLSHTDGIPEIMVNGCKTLKASNLYENATDAQLLAIAYEYFYLRQVINRYGINNFYSSGYFGNKIIVKDLHHKMVGIGDEIIKNNKVSVNNNYLTEDKKVNDKYDMNLNTKYLKYFKS